MAMVIVGTVTDSDTGDDHDGGDGICPDDHCEAVRLMIVPLVIITTMVIMSSLRLRRASSPCRLP